MTDTNSFNEQIIAEFREKNGKLGGRFEGAPMLLLHTTGAKSGEERVNPMMYQAVGDSCAVFASKAGAPTNPDWYHNLVAHSQVVVEQDGETYAAVARVTEGEERSVIWERQKQSFAQFGEYESLTDRVIPVIVLERTTS
jgi:deazaflavin-dependent oxidoreductase (nitroreductase family)